MRWWPGTAGEDRRSERYLLGENRRRPRRQRPVAVGFSSSSSSRRPSASVARDHRGSRPAAAAAGHAGNEAQAKPRREKNIQSPPSACSSDRQRTPSPSRCLLPARTLHAAAPLRRPAAAQRHPRTPPSSVQQNFAAITLFPGYKPISRQSSRTSKLKYYLNITGDLHTASPSTRSPTAVTRQVRQALRQVLSKTARPSAAIQPRRTNHRIRCNGPNNGGTSARIT